MTKEEILSQAKWAADHGYGSICLQAGERRDPKFVNFIAECLRDIHKLSVSPQLPEGLGVTISLGDQTKETYELWAEASGNRKNLRYLSRFETSNPKLFELLHSAPGNHEKNLERRFQCFKYLRECGYQLGTGVMIGIPGQTLEDLCHDIRLFQSLDVDMIGMGPYLKSEGADLKELGQMAPKPLMQLALNMIAVVRLVLGNVNIAAATALQALRDDGRETGIEYGANVVMPNLSPQKFRPGYQLYDNKPCINDRTHTVRRLSGKAHRKPRPQGGLVHDGFFAAISRAYRSHAPGGGAGSGEKARHDGAPCFYRRHRQTPHSDRGARLRTRDGCENFRPSFLLSGSRETAGIRPFFFFFY